MVQGRAVAVARLRGVAVGAQVGCQVSNNLSRFLCEPRVQHANPNRHRRTGATRGGKVMEK